ncbi:MAG: TetR family transcriptional regulator, partial [Actinomycetota bacterium]|nr:TetR family transcriptional regulator [Actinomycetota bacterium]
MGEVDHSEEQLDGRNARRQRNINALLDVVLELFSEDALFPTIEQVSARSGISRRSLYRYFADPGELHDAAIRRNRDQSVPLARLS